MIKETLKSQQNKPKRTLLLIQITLYLQVICLIGPRAGLIERRSPGLSIRASSPSKPLASSPSLAGYFYLLLPQLNHNC